MAVFWQKKKEKKKKRIVKILVLYSDRPDCQSLVPKVWGGWMGGWWWWRPTFKLSLDQAGLLRWHTNKNLFGASLYLPVYITVYNVLGCVINSSVESLTSQTAVFKRTKPFQPWFIANTCVESVSIPILLNTRLCSRSLSRAAAVVGTLATNRPTPRQSAGYQWDGAQLHHGGRKMHRFNWIFCRCSAVFVSTLHVALFYFHSRLGTINSLFFVVANITFSLAKLFCATAGFTQNYDPDLSFVVWSL